MSTSTTEPFRGTIGTTIKQSSPWWPPAQVPRAGALDGDGVGRSQMDRQ